MNTDPSYVTLGPVELVERAARAGQLLRRCTLCPHACGVDRTAGESGFCRTPDRLVVASWGPHFGEEAPLVGRFGSGTVFFSHCNLGCRYCQNWSISQGDEGNIMTDEALARVMLSLQESGCHNVNLVTPTHQVPMILRALAIAVEKGLSVPLVYNCGGYESLEVLALLDGIVDIYMPDLKYADATAAQHLSQAADYPRHAMAAVKEMHRQVGDLIIDDRGVAVRGLLVRHLVLPGGLAGTAAIARFLAEEISRDTYVNIMDQYHPCHEAFRHPPLDRRITAAEYREALEAARRAGLRRIDGVNT